MMRSDSSSLAGTVALAAGAAVVCGSVAGLSATTGALLAAAGAMLVGGAGFLRRRLRIDGLPAEDAPRPHSEAQRRDRERFAQALIEHSSDLIAILNADGTVRVASPSHQRVLGYAPAELVGRNAFDLVHPDDQAALRTAFTRNLRTGEPASREFRFRHRDGSWRMVESVAQGAFDDPDIAGAVINSRDVTERRRTEDALRESTRWLELLLSQLPAALWTVDRDLCFTAAAGTGLRRLGLSPDAALGQSVARYFGGDDPNFLPLAAHRKALAGAPQDYEFSWQTRHFLTHLEPLRDQSGETVGVVGVAHDVTEWRRAAGDKAVLLEVAHDIAGRLELDDVLQLVGARTVGVLPCDGVAIFRYDPASESIRLISHIGLPPALYEAARELSMPRGFGLEGRVLVRGETVVVNDVAERGEPLVPFLVGHGITAFVATPLTVRGRLVGALGAFMIGARRFHPPQVELLESIGRQLAIAMETADLYAAQREETAVAAALARIGRELISELNRPALLERLCRLTTEEIGCEISRTYLLDTDRDAYVAVATFGDSPEQWAEIRALELPRATVEALVGDFRAGEVVTVDADALKRSGLPLPFAGDTPRIAAMALRLGTDLVGVHAVGYRDRREPLTPRQERIARGVAQLASLALQNARLVEELDHAHRVKADFVANMSHELRTPLNVIIGYSDLLVDQTFGELDPEQRETVRRIGEQGRELLQLVNITLDMSRVESGRVPLRVEEVDLLDLLAEIELETQIVRHDARLSVTWHVAPDVRTLSTDAAKLKVIIKNLLLNAIKFTDEGGVDIQVTTRDGGVEFAVSDTGIGIAPDLMPQLFDAFRQGDHGRSSRGGVGLGLHIVQRLLTVLGGTVSVESEPQRGSTFRAWVPSLAQARSAATQRPAPRPAAAGG
jgi:PAS domain S-box-containing protein